jgi:hypothetical protein
VPDARFRPREKGTWVPAASPRPANGQLLQVTSGSLPAQQRLVFDCRAKIGDRDNKNNYVAAFLDFLVSSGMFKSVELSFMMTGHTHEVEPGLPHAR